MLRVTRARARRRLPALQAFEPRHVVVYHYGGVGVSHDGSVELTTSPVGFQITHYSRSHNAVIRVYDEAGNVIETHEHKGEFKE